MREEKGKTQSERKKYIVKGKKVRDKRKSNEVRL